MLFSVCECMCVNVCVCEREREREKEGELECASTKIINKILNFLQKNDLVDKSANIDVSNVVVVSFDKFTFKMARFEFKC